VKKKKQIRSIKKGYSYFISTTELRRWMKLPPAQKLQWLEEANLFIAKNAPTSVQQLHQAFRKGLI